MNRLIELGKRHHKNSENDLWVVCLAAYYSPNYAEFGRELGVSRSTTSRWASAYMVYNLLREYVARCNLRKLRKQLQVKHFWTLGRLWKQYEFSPDQAIAYLELAAEGMTPERMAVEIVGTEEDGMYKDWVNFSAKLRRWGEGLTNGEVPHDLPDEFRSRAEFLGVEAGLLAQHVDELRKRITDA